MLNERYQQLLLRLLGELVSCWQRPQREELLVASAFLLTQKYCNELKNETWQHGFGGDAEEIHFFKHLLPQFSGRMMYYTMVYEAILSCPKMPDEVTAFWQKETARYERFCEKNHALVHYLDSGCTARDDYYFLRKNKENVIMPAEKHLFFCCDDYTIWSGPTSSYFAEKCYREFAHARASTQPGAD